MSKYLYRKKRQQTSQVLGSALCTGISLIAGQPVAQASSIDDMQLKLSQQLPQILRWDNVAATNLSAARPYLLSPVESFAFAGQEWRSLRLQAGQSIQLRLPRGALLRLLGVNAQSIDAIQIWRSNGNQLAVREMPSQQDGALWLAPDMQHTSMLTLQLASDATQAIEFGAFVSRLEERNELAPYRSLQALPGTPQQLRGDSAGAAQDYWPFAGKQSITLHGPARYALQGRMPYRHDDVQTRQTWQVELKEGEQALPPLYFSAAAETHERQYLDGKLALLTSMATAYLDVPAGEHQYSFESSAPFLGRLLRQAATAELLFASNTPLDFNAALANPPAHSNLWDIPAAQLQAAVHGRQAESSQIAARRIAQDNRQREGGLLAWQAMRLQQQHWPAANSVQKAVQEAADEFAALSWQTLLPRDNLASSAPRLAWFSQPRLLGIAERERDSILFAQHRHSLLAGLSSGQFLPLPEQGKTQTLRYDLPPRTSDSQLQLAVQGQAGTRLLLQMDDAPPRELLLAAAAPASALQSAPALAALEMQQLKDGQFGGSTLDAAFSQSTSRANANAPLIAAQVLALELPRHVQSIKIWPAPSNEGQAWLAVNLRASQPFLMPENALLALLEQADSRKSLFAQLSRLQSMDNASANLLAAPSEAEIGSQLQGLLRLLSSQANSFRANVSLEILPAAPATNSAAAQPLAEQARALASEGNWLPALEKWAELQAKGDAAQQRAAQIGQLQALRALGENFLYEQALKQSLFSADAALSEHAYQALAELYRDDERSQLALAASRLVQTPSVQTLQQLIAPLLANGEAVLAMQAALLLPAKQRPLEQMLRLALQNRWPKLFEHLRASPGNASRARILAGAGASATRRICTSERELGTEPRFSKGRAARFPGCASDGKAFASGPRLTSTLDARAQKPAKPQPRFTTALGRVASSASRPARMARNTRQRFCRSAPRVCDQPRFKPQ